MATCIKCGTEFQMGQTGITTAQGDQCDDCAGVVRGLGGFAFEEERTSTGAYCTCLNHAGDDKKCPVHGAS